MEVAPGAADMRVVPLTSEWVKIHIYRVARHSYVKFEPYDTVLICGIEYSLLTGNKV
ncbi:hypothetical protein LCGC14_2553060 [marine sediment metagenome]|uniref:Uncharacterized protein n=1 Tax=marine sediment metagenome TaxID=412755 RepID=A0A0F9AMZ2_9ZZZZ